MISKGRPSIGLSEILNKLSEADIIAYYLGIEEIPCLICSPLRNDKHPSFGIYSPNGVEVNYIDFSTRDGGRSFTLLGKLWNMDSYGVAQKIAKDFKNILSGKTPISTIKKCSMNVINKSYNSDLLCKVRKWEKHDIEYWGSYGITKKWLHYAEIYPISHKIITRNGQKFTFGADKYAYAYVEHKEGKVTLKIYQPFNKKGFKWANKHDSSVISLWTKVPEFGDYICICASLKDALCLWSNTGIPSLAIQGEGYKMSDTAISELKRRYKNIFICLDNDEPGLKDAERLAKETGFINIVLPNFDGGKDISDLYHTLPNKKDFNIIMLGLFKEKDC